MPDLNWPMRAGPRRRAIGNGAGALPDGSLIDRTNNSLDFGKIYFLPPEGGQATDFVLGFPGFAIATGESPTERDLPGPYQVVECWIDSPYGMAPRQVFQGGSPSWWVYPGRRIVYTDPLPIMGQPGTQIRARGLIRWQGGEFWLGYRGGAMGLGEWTKRGLGLQSSIHEPNLPVGTDAQHGFGPMLFATSCARVLGIPGDSIGQAATDYPDPAILQPGIARGMRGAPVLNLARGSNALQHYLPRTDGVQMLFRDGVDDVLVELGDNDVYTGTTLSDMKAMARAAIAPSIARGQPTYFAPILPRTYSTDGWLTRCGQTFHSGAFTAAALAFNAWLRAEWVALGLAGIVDMARAVDPGDTGTWGADPGASIAPLSFGAAAFPVVHGGVITSAPLAAYNGSNSTGWQYPAEGCVIPCIVTPYPGETGHGAVIRAHVAPGTQYVSWFEVVHGGEDYSAPPMLHPAGPWTCDGVHPIAGGYNAIIAGTGFGPAMFRRGGALRVAIEVEIA